MNSTSRDWREYQQAVAAHFRQLGCVVAIEERIQGVRATHAVDVSVRFHQHGVDCLWIIECKLWKRRVRKENVMTLKSIVDDIGADRGIIFSENGFQSGALKAVSYTNILPVTSLEDFKRTVQLSDTSVPLTHREPEEARASPIYVFPNGDQPQHLLLFSNRVFVGNWGTGNIAIVDPFKKSIATTINLDKYEGAAKPDGSRTIRQYPPGDMACADGKLFVGQVFSDFVLAIDIATQSIVKRIPIPGGGQGAITASRDGRYIYFASNKENRFFVIDSATYQYQEIDYPPGGRGSLCVLSHPSKPLLYIGIQRGGNLNGRSYSGGNSFLATYDLQQHRYVGYLYLAEITNGRGDDSTPICLTFDEDEKCLFVGMFQSKRGICRVDENGTRIEADFRFATTADNKHFTWVDPLSQALHRNRLVSVNRNNCELVTLDKRSGEILDAVYLGNALNGPRAVVVIGDTAIVSYPERQGLIFHNLSVS
jgi:hypothetical protein